VKHSNSSQSNESEFVGSWVHTVERQSGRCGDNWCAGARGEVVSSGGRVFLGARYLYPPTRAVCTATNPPKSVWCPFFLWGAFIFVP
jgi:hypothetical protein